MTKRRRAPRARAASARRPRASGIITQVSPDWLILHPWLREAGVAVTSDSAIQVAAVYGCCRLIVDCLAPAPMVVTELRKGGLRETLHDDPVGWALNYGAPIAQAPDALTPQAIEEALYWSALAGDGNGYAEIQWDRSGRFYSLWPIDPGWVKPKRDDAGFHYEITSPNGGGPARLEPASMFHLHGPSLRGYVGDSTVYRGSKAIGIAHAAQVFAAAYFANGTVISGLLSSDAIITKTQADDAKAEWAKNHGGGPGSQHGIAVLGKGVKYQPLNHDAQQSAMVEQRRFQVAEIARFFGVPTTLLADNEAWTNLGALWDGFYRQCLRPWAARFDAEATRKLFPQRQPWREVAHDLTHLTLGSFKEQVDATVAAVNGGVWTRNEARALFGKNSVPDGDVLVVTGVVKSLEDALDPPEPPAPKLTSPRAEPDDPPSNQPDPVNTRPTLSARDAIVAMFADAFARHARRIKGGRPRSAEGLAQDCAAAWALASRALPGDAGPMDLAPFADALEQGEPPDKAAERFVSGIWRDAA